MYSGYAYPFHVYNASASTATSGLTECLIYHPGILYSTVHQETHFRAKEAKQGAHNHGIKWSYYKPHHSEATGITERWNGLLKSQLQCQLGDNTLKSKDFVLQDAVYALNQRPIHSADSVMARIVQESNVEVRVDLLTITPNNPLAEVLLPILATLNPVGWKSLSPNGSCLVLPWNGKRTATWIFWVPYATKSTGKKGKVSISQMGWLILITKGNGVAMQQQQGGLCLEPRRFSGVPLSSSMPSTKG